METGGQDVEIGENKKKNKYYAWTWGNNMSDILSLNLKSKSKIDFWEIIVLMEEI